VKEETIQVGDRVITVAVPGIFTVLARRGALVDIENERGVRKTVAAIALRRVNGTPPQPKDA
jgi:hypothetical protein